MGAAITAGVGVGVFDSFDVIDRFLTISDTFQPNWEQHNQYQRLKPVFQKSYPLLRSTLHELGDFQQGTL